MTSVVNCLGNLKLKQSTSMHVQTMAFGGVAIVAFWGCSNHWLKALVTSTDLKSSTDGIAHMHK